MSRVVLVTGGSSGFGATAARKLASQGDKVVIADINEAAGSALAEEIGGLFVRCDVASLQDNEAAVAAAEETYGGLDVALLNAGILGGMVGVDDFTVARYELVVGVNFTSVPYGIQAVVPAMRKRGGGTIVATASLAGLIPLPDDPIYAATKHAVVAYCRAIAPLLEKEQIRVNIACPGFAGTPLIEDFEERFNAIDFPLLTPEQVADVMVAMTDATYAGQAVFIQPGREPGPFRFASIPGARKESGDPAGLPPSLT